MAIVSRGFRELKLDGVSRDFGLLNALKGVTLDVKRGEFIALLGPSGCGKSTALNCLAGLLPLTGGSIWLDEDRIDTRRPEERGFGMVFQNYALFPHMSVRKNVGFGLRMKGTPRADIERKVDEALALVRLTAQSEKLPGQLSGGQQQRVAIARAIVTDPTLLLADEPTGDLDAKSASEVLTLLQRLNQEFKKTIVMVTHDPHAAERASHVLHLEKGTLVEQVTS